MPKSAGSVPPGYHTVTPYLAIRGAEGVSIENLERGTAEVATSEEAQ